MKQYTVTTVAYQELWQTVVVEALNEKEALDKVRTGDTIEETDTETVQVKNTQQIVAETEIEDASSPTTKLCKCEESRRDSRGEYAHCLP